MSLINCSVLYHGITRERLCVMITIGVCCRTSKNRYLRHPQEISPCCRSGIFIFQSSRAVTSIDVEAVACFSIFVIALHRWSSGGSERHLYIAHSHLFINHCTSDRLHWETLAFSMSLWKSHRNKKGFRNPEACSTITVAGPINLPCTVCRSVLRFPRKQIDINVVFMLYGYENTYMNE